jgi:uncharacterized protein
MPLVSGSKAKTEKGFKTNVKREIAAGKDPKQAVAIAYSKKRGDSKDDDILEFDEAAEAWVSKKIAELIKEGYGQKQAEAIAYAEHRRNAKDNDTGTTFKIYDSATKREYDLNGWAEIKDNPISKVGVFPYFGRDISPDLIPDQIYNVYRPADELADPETIKSFKLLPWTDEHAMLGSEDDGLLPAEKKGIHGVIGEDVYYSDGYLKGNVKIFSNKLANLIDKGKKELSIGYRCLYDMVSGVFEGQKYDAVQRNIRGNHLALVDEGRSGHDVAVLDHFKYIFDAKEIKMPDEKRQGEMKDEEMSLEGCYKMLKDVMAKVDKLMSKGEDEEEGKKELSEESAHEGDTKDEEGEYKKFVNKAEVTEDKDYDEQESEEVEDEDENEASSLSEEEKSQDEDKPGDMSKPKDKKGKDKKAMDSRLTAKAIFNEISRRDALAHRLSTHIGTFDHSHKTFNEVAQYGLKKLGLRCKVGQEAAMLEGFLSAARRSTVVATGKDSAIKSGCIDAYLNGGE